MVSRRGLMWKRARIPISVRSSSRPKSRSRSARGAVELPVQDWQEKEVPENVRQYPPVLVQVESGIGPLLR
jgi:hypothetical protein